MKMISRILLMVMALAFSMSAQAERIKPFVLAYKTTDGTVAAHASDVKGKLTAAGFQIAGEFSPYEGAHVIVVTNDRLKDHAAKSEWGGYGAVQRVSVTKVGEEIQVAYTNARYMANAYRMEEELEDVHAALAKALGEAEHFGAKKGLTPRKLRKYHYMFGMEYFDEPSDLAQYPSFQKAVAAVEANLAKGVNGITQVYRIDIPGKDEVVFGIARKAPSENDRFMDDKYIMGVIDFQPLRSTAHLPYEIMVSGNKVYALYARFRIAMNFPDLSMMGENSFMNIMETPKTLEKALIKAAGGDSGSFSWDE